MPTHGPNHLEGPKHELKHKTCAIPLFLDPLDIFLNTPQRTNRPELNLTKVDTP